MVTINKVYTRTGDKGETSLVGGRRTPKDDARIESYGTIDELNSIIGIARSLALQEDGSQWEKICLILRTIQQKLFDLGSELATHKDDAYEGQIMASKESVIWLEELIDTLNKDLEPLQSFVLPGGDMINAHLHQARTVCRRAERMVIRFARNETINPQIIAFLNRLSDLFFVMSRWVCFKRQQKETLWQPDMGLPRWKG
jgi:cob(I)alamin adenosyltransferase